MAKVVNSALQKQVGGDHYKTGIQPVEYCHANGLNFLEGSVVKYITRHRRKGGREDVEKALHYCEMILALDYPEPPPPGPNEIKVDMGKYERVFGIEIEKEPTPAKPNFNELIEVGDFVQIPGGGVYEVCWCDRLSLTTDFSESIYLAKECKLMGKAVRNIR